MLLVLPVLIISLGVIGGRGDVDEHELEDFLDPRREGDLKNFVPAVAVVPHPGYRESCSDCHLDYSPNLLPARSWEKLMEVTELEDHFGEYIYLEEDERQAILNYLVDNSAETSPYSLPGKIIKSIPDDETPIRIREVKAIFRRHDTLPEKYTLYNQKVLSLSQCQACHQQADKGVFDQGDVYIPYEMLQED